MSQAAPDLFWEGSAPMRDAMGLVTLARECVASGVERRALYLRLSLLPARLRDPRHHRLVREVLAPVLRPTRARLYELPGGDLVVLSPPPGEHLDEVRKSVCRVLPEMARDSAMPLLRLPAESARMLSLLEASLGLQALPVAAQEIAAALPFPSAAEMDAALRALATANLSAYLRRQTIWRLVAGDEEPQPIWTELRPHVPNIAAALLPGRALAAHPAFARRFRHAAERRILAELSRPEEARKLGAACLPLGLGTVTEAEFLRLEAVLGPRGRRDLVVCIPVEEMLLDPTGFALARELADRRGWRLGLDEMEPELLPLLPASRLDLPLLRLRFRPQLVSGDGALRATWDAALPADRSRIVLVGADAPVAVAWAWQRGITLFGGRVLEARL
nr:hypothetical protein [uncultured Roseococcus sp.]